MPMSKRALGWAAVVAASIVAIAAGCSLVTSYDGFAPDGPVCGKRVPDRPSAAKGAQGGEIVGAMSELRFIPAQDGAPLGFDLDKLCTCPGKRACTNASAADQQCDVPNTGIDNAGGLILSVLFPAQLNAQLQGSLRAGVNGLVVRVLGWDGTPDDADVKVSLYNVVGLKGSDDGGALARFDGNDELIVDDSSLLTTADLGSKYFDTSAYVAGGVLVAAFDFDFRLAVPNLIDAAAPPSAVEVPLRTARLVGKIERVGAAGLRMGDAQLVGRLPADRIFTQLSRIGLCQNSPDFAKIKGSTCASLDLPTSPSQDGRNVACDALSFAIGLKISPARLGGHAASAPAAGPCGEEAPQRCP
ncbi:hypothetical protein BH11MYX4_BH11MYX4_04230 [soil metagenome]